MRCFVCFVAFAIPVLSICSLLGQETAKPQQASSPGTPSPKRDLEKFTDKQKYFYFCGQRALEWLQKANKPDGRFVYGFLPALAAPMDGDSYFHQAGAAMALARAGKFYGDERATAIAQQALLTLLLETTKDPKEATLRYTAAPPELIHRPTASAMLALAIHELDTPGKDLLEQADELLNYLHTLVEAGGSIRVAENRGGADAAIQHYSGPVLYAMIHSQRLRPTEWKLDALRRSRAVYATYWKQYKNAPMIPSHTAAYVEAYLATKDQEFADTVFEMNDWLCSLQYQDLDRRRAHWTGGFQQWVDGKAAQIAPDIRSAEFADSLAHACRLARLQGDVERFGRYRTALECALKFIATLQYNDANARHFADWFRPAIVGGFHASYQDGNLRIDYCQHALSALVLYLEHAADLP